MQETQIPSKIKFFRFAGCGVIAAALLAAFFLSKSFQYLLPPEHVGDVRELEKFIGGTDYFSFNIPGAEDTGVCTVVETASGEVEEEMIYYAELENMGLLIAVPIRPGYETALEMPLSLPAGERIMRIGPNEEYCDVIEAVDREKGYSAIKPLYEYMILDGEFYFLRGRVNAVLLLGALAVSLALMLFFLCRGQKQGREALHERRDAVGV